MITLARESRGLTQKEVALLTDISQAELSRFEGGDRLPTKEQIATLAKVLRYRESFFHDPGQRYSLGSSGIYHRRKKAISAKTLTAIHARVNLLRMVVEKLAVGVDIEHDQKFPQMRPEQFHGNIEAIAEHVRAAWGLPDGPIRDLIGAIENAGGIVHSMDLGTPKIDALVQWVPPAPPVFVVNANSPGDRLRFSLAHEVGHVVMHHYPHDEGIEEQANEFASALLMPARDIRRDLEPVTIPRLAQLKPYWRVSIAALIRRARDIGRITDRQYRSMNEEMGRLGYRIHEPSPIGREQSTLLQEMIDAHYKELNYTPAGLAALVGMEEKEFTREYSSSAHKFRIFVSFTR